MKENKSCCVKKRRKSGSVLSGHIYAVVKKVEVKRCNNVQVLEGVE